MNTMKRLTTSKWVPYPNYISAERNYDSLITPLPTKTQGGLIRCSLFSSKIKVLRMAQNLNDHVHLGKMILMQLVSSKTKFVWEIHCVIIALLNRRNLQQQKISQSLYSQQFVLLMWQVTRHGQCRLMENQGWTSGNICLGCTVVCWCVSTGFILDQWKNAMWQDRRPPRGTSQRSSWLSTQWIKIL